MRDDEAREAIIDEICRRLEEGDGLGSICADPAMPARNTVWRWANGDDEIAARIRASREIGFVARAERLIDDVRDCSDPIKARLIFDAERWYLGKLSNAFAERPVAIGVQVNVESSDTYNAITRALQEAAAARASLATSTSAVVIEGTARPADAPRQLADLAGTGGARLGEDEDGR